MDGKPPTSQRIASSSTNQGDTKRQLKCDENMIFPVNGGADRTEALFTEDGDQGESSGLCLGNGSTLGSENLTPNDNNEGFGQNKNKSSSRDESGLYLGSGSVLGKESTGDLNTPKDNSRYFGQNENKSSSHNESGLYLGSGSVLGNESVGGKNSPNDTTRDFRRNKNNSNSHNASGLYLGDGDIFGNETLGIEMLTPSTGTADQSFWQREDRTEYSDNESEESPTSLVGEEEKSEYSSTTSSIGPETAQLFQFSNEKKSLMTAGAATEQDDDEIPVTLIRGHSFLRQQLSSSDFSHEENREEFLTLDYTPAINVRPIDLHTPLRSIRLGRDIKVCVCITMYNEDADELYRSLHGIASNLRHLDALGIHWTQVQVCVVADGRGKLNEFTKEYLSNDLHVYDEDLILTQHKGNNVTCHIFEKTVEIKKDLNQKEYFPPVQILLAVKEKNGGKLNSHLWFFSAFSKQLQPKYCVLVDVGTGPKEKAIYYLVQAMEQNPQVGGATGEIEAQASSLCNVLEAAQFFEYRSGHVMDKPMESVFGYISVLPGAFSAFRWEAIKGEPLSQYFKLEETDPLELGPFIANMYLAEDRILCFEISAKRGKAYTLTFVRQAVAITDIPTTLVELTKQRRRWLNGAFFALLYYISKFWNLLGRSGHSTGRRTALIIQFVYYLSLIFFNWFGVALLYLSFVMIVTFAVQPIGNDFIRNGILFAFHLFYLCLSAAQVLFGLGSKLKDSRKIYLFSSVVYGLLVLIAFGLSIWHITQGASLPVLLIGASGFGTFFVAAILYGRTFSMVSTFLQYLFLVPTFLTMFTIYSFCNLDDISWGTKEGNLQTAIAVAQAKVKAKGVDVEEIAELHDAELSEAQKTVQEKLKQLEEAAKSVGTSKEFDPAIGDKNQAKPKRDTQAMYKTAEELEYERLYRQLERKKLRIQKKRDELQRSFSAFRTRIITLWVFSNFFFSALIISFDWINEFSLFISGAVVFQMSYRLIGTIFYRLEEGFKFFWEKSFAWWCTCITCPWQRSRNQKKRSVETKHPQRRMSDMQRHVGRVKGENLREHMENGYAEQDKDAQREEEDEDEAVWGRQSWADYAGYGIVQEKPKYDPTTGKTRRKSQLLGWDEELCPDKLQKLAGRRQSIFDSAQSVLQGRQSQSRVSFALRSSIKCASVATQHPGNSGKTQDAVAIPVSRQIEETSAAETETTGQNAQNNVDSDAVKEETSRQQVPSLHHLRSFSSCASVDIEACLADGEFFMDALDSRYRDGEEKLDTYNEQYGKPLPYRCPTGGEDLRRQLKGDLRPLWRRKKPLDDSASVNHSTHTQSLSPQDVVKPDNETYSRPRKADILTDKVEDSSYTIHEESEESSDDEAAESIAEDSAESQKATSVDGWIDGFLRRQLRSSELSYDEDETECVTLDYTPITVHPFNIPSPLRTTRLNRRTEISICLTYHTQPLYSIQRTLQAVAENISYLVKSGVKSDAIVLNLVVDGREDVPKDVYDYLKYSLRILDEDMMLMTKKGEHLICHIFERTVRIPRHAATREYHSPIQLMLTLKERTGGMLNSHMWFFGINKQIRPKYCLILNTGTMPKNESVKNLYQYMELDAQIGIISGEIRPHDARLYSITQASQIFRSKLSHVLEKPSDTFSGLVTPFSGSYTMYRLIAIQGDPIDTYFRVEDESLVNFTPFSANLYLTVERLMNFETVMKRRENWLTHYVNDAPADQELPRSLLDSIVSERRNMTGALLSGGYYLNNISRLWTESYHTLSRKLLLSIQIFVSTVYLTFLWFAPAVMYIVFFYIFTTSVSGLGFGTVIISFGFHVVYIGTTTLQILFSLGSRPEDVERVFFTSAIIYGVFMYVAFGLFALATYQGVFSPVLLYALAVGAGTIAMAALIHGSLSIMILSFFQYMFMLPTFVNLFMVYSFCNLHDISWRLKNSEGSLDVLAAQARSEMQENAKDVKAFTGSKRPSLVLEQAEIKLRQLQNANWFENDNPDAPPNLLDEHEVEPEGRSKHKNNAPRLSVMTDPRQILEQAYQAAERKKIDERIDNFKERIKQEHDHLSGAYAAFRTRSLGLWLLTNWMTATMVNLSGNLRNGATFIIYALAIILVWRLLGSICFVVRQYAIDIWTAGFSWWCTCCKCPWQSRKVVSLKRFRRQVNNGQAPQMVIDCSDIDDVASEASDAENKHNYFMDVEDVADMSDEEFSSSQPLPQSEGKCQPQKVDAQVSTDDLQVEYSSESENVATFSSSVSARRSSVPGWSHEDGEHANSEESNEAGSQVSIGELLREAEETVERVEDTLNVRYGTPQQEEDSAEEESSYSEAERIESTVST